MKYKNYNDYELISQIEENNEESYYSLLNKYSPIIKNIASEYYIKYSNYGCDYDDFLQEAYIGFQSALKSFDSDKNILFYTFVDVCIRRHLASFSRKITLSKKNINNKYFFPINDYAIADSSCDVENILDNMFYYDIVKDVLFSVDIEFSAPFELMMNNFKYWEICTLLDLSLNVVLYRIRFVRSLIKKKLNMIDKY